MRPVRRTPRTTSPSSKGSKRYASGPACTSARPARPGCTTWSGRSWTTRSTRPWRAAPPGSTSPCWPTAACRVTDDGAGIPVGPHPKYPKQSTAEIVLTTLHAGGKFGGKGYQVSGGLHGVGISVVNALSTRLLLEVDRDGQHWEAEFEKGGKLKKKITATGPAPNDRSTGEPRTGTTVTFWPDSSVFDETEFRAQTIVERMQIMAFLNKGLEIRFVDERTDPVTKTTYKYNGGIVDFVKHLNASKESLFRKVASFEQAEEGQEVEIALQWNAGPRPRHRFRRPRTARCRRSSARSAVPRASRTRPGTGRSRSSPARAPRTAPAPGTRRRWTGTGPGWTCRSPGASSSSAAPAGPARR